MRHFLTVDVEEWFQRHNFRGVIKRQDWGDCQDRVEYGTKKILELFAKHGKKATFFVLGWVAKRHPGLIKEIAAQGHEVATHGHDHSLVYEMTPQAFREDLKRSIKSLEDITGQKIIGHRAPSFSLNKDSAWALDILLEEGIKYDSSVFPSAFYADICLKLPEKGTCKVKEGLLEVPFSVVDIAGLKFPFGGGGYFRIYPYWLTKACFAAVGKNMPAMFYIHPNDVDPGEPRVKLAFAKNFKEYTGQKNTAGKLGTLLKDFDFGPVKEILSIA